MNEIIILKGEDKTKDIEKWYLEGDKLQVKFFNQNKFYSYLKDKYQIIRKEKSNILEYFKALTKIVSIKDKDDKALLEKQYAKIQNISKESVLYRYLNPHLSFKKYENKDILLFPFSANKSQIQALHNALNNQISVIEGPPGTGKTQTILNIIANLLYHDKSIAVLSNNNSATQNVFEKLQKQDFEYLCAMLGKKENKFSFIKDQILTYPQFEIKNTKELTQKIQTCNKHLQNIFELQNFIATHKAKLSELSLEFEHFLKQNEGLISVKLRKNTKAEAILKAKIELEEKEKVLFLSKVKMIYLYGIGDFTFFTQELKTMLEKLDLAYYKLKIKELEKELEQAQNKLNKLNKNDILKDLQHFSLELLKSTLQKKQQGKRIRFELEDLYTKSENFIKEYPIVFSTTHSIKQCLNPNFKFDYIIVDEASQVDLISAVLALDCAKNAVIVGDTKQLPNIISSEKIEEINALTQKFNIKTNYDYAKQSLLSSMLATFKDIPQVLLQEHYRCHPKIIEFCNKKFYNEKLIILSEDKAEKSVIEIFITASGNHARGHYNQRQIDVIQKEILPSLKDKIKDEDIGIITPYRLQKEKLENQINPKIQIDTVHKFQGREKEAIIISTTDNEISDFVDDDKMLNVAVTRAKKYLAIIVSSKIEQSRSNIADLIKYARYINHENIKQSKIKSIFDLLYQENFAARLQYLKNKKGISSFYDSEKIAYLFVKKFLCGNGFDFLSVACFVPLYRLINDISMLKKDEEVRYAKNPLTHIDMVLFHKMDKTPVLAIEVDGYFYHKQGTKQAQRDELKNTILKSYQIPLLRLSTINSGEEEL